MHIILLRVHIVMSDLLRPKLRTAQVHMLRDEIKADLLELQEERFKNFQQSVAKVRTANLGETS